MSEKLLTDLAPDEEAEITNINGGWMMKTRLKELGIIEGQWIKIISRLGLGGPVGSGRQYMSWIAREDLVRVLQYLVERDLSGPVNAVAPIR